MSILSRAKQIIFGDSGGTGEFGQIGSKAAGAPATTKNLATMQSLTEYLQGLNAIVSDQGTSVLPYLEDMNSLFFLTTSQLAYIFQSGVPEWETNTDYYKALSVVLEEASLWIDKIGVDPSPNQGNNPLTNLDKWDFIASPIRVLSDQDISAGNQTTDLTIYESGGGSELPDKYKLKITWSGGDSSFYHRFTTSGYTIGNSLTGQLTPGDGTTTYAWVGNGSGELILQLDKINSKWDVVTEGTWDIGKDSTGDKSWRKSTDKTMEHYIFDAAITNATTVNYPLPFTTGNPNSDLNIQLVIISSAAGVDYTYNARTVTGVTVLHNFGASRAVAIKVHGPWA